MHIFVYFTFYILHLEVDHPVEETFSEEKKFGSTFNFIFTKSLFKKISKNEQNQIEFFLRKAKFHTFI